MICYSTDLKIGHYRSCAKIFVGFFAHASTELIVRFGTAVPEWAANSSLF
jgi:hypothetical protein